MVVRGFSRNERRKGGEILRRQLIFLRTLEWEIHEFPYNSYLLTLPSSVELGDLSLFFSRERTLYYTQTLLGHVVVLSRYHPRSKVSGRGGEAV